LAFEENLLGILWVWGKGITKADLPIMSIFAKQIGISLERARLFQEVQSLALTDPLTGLQNRRSLFELGRIEFSRAQRMERPFCCMMLDLDHFKQINDNYGHPMGDQVIREFAKRCKASVREVDLIGRYGAKNSSYSYRKLIQRQPCRWLNDCEHPFRERQSKLPIRN